MSKYTVLSIDDDESARTLFEMMLKRSGFNVVQAVDADDALEKLEAGADLIQLWTGFVYEGPGSVKKINKASLAVLED